MLSTHPSDTIAAIATGRGGGIGIVRVSGPSALEVVGRLVRPWPKTPHSHKLHHGHVHDPRTGDLVDEVLACVMRAPNSYTGEDVAEIHGHGGAAVLELVLGATLAAGARLADPGEFTRRAFFAGKVDLAQAEAIAQLVGARSERAVRIANAVKGGALSREVDGARRTVVEALAELDGAIDFPEEELDAASHAEVASRTAELGAHLIELADSHRQGRLLEQAPLIVLCGRVNAGKSTLFNRLVGEERALVDSRPGTTRDVVEADVELTGIVVRLADTAGERGAEAPFDRTDLEHRGIDLGRKRRDAADLVVLVIDGEVGFVAEDASLWASLDPARRLLVWNKRDRAAPAGLPSEGVAVPICAERGEGLAELRRELVRLLEGRGAGEDGEDGEAEGVVVVSARHEGALRVAAGRLAAAAAQLGRGEPAELAAIELRGALDALGEISGATASDEVLDAIFSRFCIGK